MTSKEALNDLKKRNEALKNESHFHIGSQTMEVIQKLVERDTPMKPLKYEYGGYQCPNCKWLDVQLYNSDGSEKNLNYCDSCGQKLLWE